MREPNEREMRKLLFAAIREGADHCVIVTGSAQGMLRLDRPPPPEFGELPALHEERLLALIDQPVLLAIYWDDGDRNALVSIIPAAPNEPFKTFLLPFSAPVSEEHDQGRT
jgi:hypothetical protein